MRVRRWLPLALALALLAAPLAAQALLPPLEPVLGGGLIDGVGDQLSPVVAVAAGGAGVVVWVDRTPPPSPTVVIGSPAGPIAPAATNQTRGLLFQRFTAEGERAGPIGEVSGDTPASYAVAMNDAGGFVVVWESVGEGLVARRFRPGGAAEGELITFATDVDAVAPAVAMDSAGNFVAIWQHYIGGGNTVSAAVFNADGSLRRAPFDVPPTRTEVGGADVASDAAGNFVVVWEATSPDAGLQLLRFDRQGVAQTSEPQPVRTLDAGQGSAPAVAMDDGGDFVVVWEHGAAGGRAVAYRRFTGAGAPLNPYEADPIVAEQADGAFAMLADVAMDDAGNFSVSWNQSRQAVGTVSVSDVYLQRYTAAGAPAQLVELTTRPAPDQAPIAADAAGALLATWRAGNAIIAQPFRQPAVLIGQSADNEGGVRDTRVAEGGRGDFFSLGLRTAPTGTVTITLTPESPQVNLTLDRDAVAVAQASPGAPLSVVFGSDDVGTVVFVDVTAVDDADAEGTHFTRVRVTAEGPGTGYAFTPLLVIVDGEPADGVLVTIADNDLAGYALETSTAGTTEGSGQPVTFTLFRSGAIRGRSAVGYRFIGTATYGKDYTVRAAGAAVAASGVLTFTAGQRSTALLVEVIDDALGEPLKTIGLQLTGPVPEDAGEVAFPVALVTLGDNDLAEVRVTQTGGSTVVGQDGAPDTLSVALRTVPGARVTVTLTPTDRRINLGMGYGTPLRLTFEPDESAKTPQQVEVFTSGGRGEARLAANAGIGLSASSADEGYGAGARFTVDGRDLGTIPVEVVTLPGESPNPVLPSVYLPYVAR